MIAVSNTSPLNYLVLIDLQDVLPVLFGRGLIPAAVRRELEAQAAPEPIRRWMAAGAPWLETREVSDPSVYLEQLGAGEREAIRLAEETETAVVLLDEKKVRRIARDRGLVVSGTLGVLDVAARRGLLDLPAALDRLEQTTFRASPRLLRLVRERHSAGRS
jgi:predicted nucleic acid-binding protein